MNVINIHVPGALWISVWLSRWARERDDSRLLGFSVDVITTYHLYNVNKSYTCNDI